MVRFCLLVLIALVAAFGCGGPKAPSSKPRIIIFVLDSPIDQAFVEGREASRPASQVSHGSLVGRVIRRYCGAELVSIPVEDASGSVSHQAYLGGLRQVLAYAAAHPQDRMIANISLGSSTPDPQEEDLVRRLNDAGVLVVAAAGNESSAKPDYPAGYAGVVAVAAATPEGKAPSSNYGAHVSIAASGDITFIDYEYLPYEQLRREMDARGTSFAAPRVAAAVAWVLARRPALSVQEAYRTVRAAAQPIEDDHFRRGQLGAGLLDVSRLRTLAGPGFLFLHYVLPVIVWVLLGVLSVWLCLRHGTPGLFISLLLWLIALPTAALLVLDLGPIGVVLVATALVAAGSAWVKKRRPPAVVSAGAAAVEALGRADDPHAVELLLTETAYPDEALAGLAEVARRVPELLVGWLESYETLPAEQQWRLYSALMWAGNPQTVALLDEVCRKHPSPALEEFLKELRAMTASTPDGQ